jgi:radical SAM protein with 4Fe4S-binding SPASM domain
MIRPGRLSTAGLELTLACPCRCETCGSGGGTARPDELDPGEMLAVVGELSRLGCRRLTFSGGEPLLRPDWPVLAREASRLGMAVDMITSGIGLDEKCAGELRRAGLVSVTVSVDGTGEAHDRLRGVSGGFGRALEALRRLDEAGLRAGVSTQVNRLSLPLLEGLAPLLEEAGATGWQLQLTMPTGRGRGRDDIVLPADMMPEVHRVLRRLIRRRGLRPYVADNLGYLGRDDPVLRTPAGAAERCWLGCFAGLRLVGITSSGGVKGCLSLPDDLVEGNVREEPLEAIWGDPKRFAYNRAFDSAGLGGACAGCEYGRICRGGCTSLALAVHGRPGISTHCFRLFSTGQGPAERRT